MNQVSSSPRPEAAADVTSAFVPTELLEQFERGNVLLLVGEGINDGILPSALELAQRLKERCGYPDEEPLQLPRVAGYYEFIRNDRHGLIQFLSDRLAQPVPATPRPHALMAQLPLHVVVTTCYDRLLERALDEAGVSYVAVVANAEIAYSDRRKLLLARLWGALDQPDSLIITEDDRRMFLEGRANLSDVLRGELARSTWVFLGFDPEDEWFRTFFDSVTRSLDRHGRRAYLAGTQPGAYIQTWCQKHNVQFLDVDIETLLETLGKHAPAAPGLSLAPGASMSLPLPQEPYKALLAYESKDRALFFGRTREIQELTARIHAHRLVLLYGLSGVGKTSLLQAGVIPQLEHPDLGYTVISVRAIGDPADAIRATLRRKLSGIELAPDHVPLADLVVAAIEASGRPVVIVIDQFEEFFIRFGRDLRAEFIAELGTMYDAADLRVKVVLSLREDYLASVGELESRIPDLFRAKMRLLPLTREQARDAIVCPAQALGYAYQPALVERLLDDLTLEAVMPPQLQLVCGALVRNIRGQGRKRITGDDYEAAGGSQGVLRDYLKEELRTLPAVDQVLASRVLEELITSEQTKKVETLAELCTALNADPATLDRVVEKLVRARLLRPVESGEVSGWGYEYPHEAPGGSQGNQAALPALPTLTGYELVHEYLIKGISLGPGTIARKEAEELLHRELLDWEKHRTLVGTDKLKIILESLDVSRVSPSAIHLLLRSALVHDWGEEQLWADLWQPAQSAPFLKEMLALKPPLADGAREWAARTAAYAPPSQELEAELVRMACFDASLDVKMAAFGSLGAYDLDPIDRVMQYIEGNSNRLRDEVRAQTRPGTDRFIWLLRLLVLQIRASLALGWWTAGETKNGKLYFADPRTHAWAWPIFATTFFSRMFLFLAFDTRFFDKELAAITWRGPLYAGLAVLAGALLWLVSESLNLPRLLVGALLGAGVLSSAFRLYRRQPNWPKPGSLSLSALSVSVWKTEYTAKAGLRLHALVGALLGGLAAEMLPAILMSAAESATSLEETLFAATVSLSDTLLHLASTMPTYLFILLGLALTIIAIILFLGLLVIFAMITDAVLLFGWIWLLPAFLISAGLCSAMHLEHRSTRLRLRLILLAPPFFATLTGWLLLSRPVLLGWLLGLIAWAMLFSAILYFARMRPRPLSMAAWATVGFLLGGLVSLLITGNWTGSVACALIAGGLSIVAGQVEQSQARQARQSA